MTYINWKVEDISVHTADPRCVPSLEANLTGYIENFGAFQSRSIKEITQEIEVELNRNDSWCPKTFKPDNKDVAMQMFMYRNFMHEPEITNVEFNPPLTVVIWSDKTKTFVRAQDDEPFDPEKGLAMAIAKKFLGNNGGYFDEFKKWLKKNEERTKKKEHKALKKSEPIGKVIAKNVTDQAVTFTAKLSDSDAIKRILCHDDSGKFTLSFDAVTIEKEPLDITVCEDGWDDLEMPSALVPMDVFVETGADLIELIEIVKSGIEDNGFFTLNEYYDFSGYSVTDDPQSKQYDISKYGWTEPPIFRTKFYDDGFLLKASAAKLLEVNK